MNKLRLFALGILFLVPILISAQSTITGTVTEQATGDPLPGVNVTIQGTDQGTTTDFDGNYSLSNVKNGSVLEFTYVGFLSQIITVNSNVINVSLEASSESLDEIIIIGYGAVSKKDATGSVSVVGVKDLKNEGVASPEQMLVGKIAGVTVTPSGAPGGGGAIRIRESTSLFAGQSPLIVIDGVPGGSMFNLNNNDIESFTVLKDASATAIYGVQGSNGVILITTKKGKIGETKFEYNNSFTFKKLIKQADALSASEFTSFVNANGSAQQISLLGTENTNWQDEIFDQGRGMNHDFNMSGGNEKVNFRVGLGYATEDGILKTSNFEKGTYSFKVGTKLLKDRLKVDVSYVLTQLNIRNANTGAISSAISYDPTKPVYTNNQTYGGYYQWLNANGSPVSIGAPANPVALLNQTHNTFNSTSGIGSLKFNYKIPYIEGLKANLVLGLDHSNGKGQNIVDNDSWTTANLIGGEIVNFGNKSKFKNEHTNKLLDFYLNYKRDIESINGNLDFMVGYSYQDFDNSNISVSNLQGEPSAISEVFDSFNPANLQSFFTRLNFNLNNKYIFTATFRRDLSSRFFDSNESATNNPSAAFAWKVTEEDFMNGSVFSNLKLRLGWGKIGQQDIPISFPGLATYLFSTQTAQYQFGGDFITTARAQPYNPLLKWETTTTYNLGTDFGFLDNKISGSIELFLRKSDDLLNRLPFPAGSSLSNEDWANIGSLENKGVEFTLNSKLISKDDLKLNVSLNATYNTTEITKLTAADDGTSQGVAVGGFTGGVGNTIQVHSVGYAPNSFYVYQQVYDTNGNPVEGVYVDRNNDGLINSDDKYRFKRPSADVTLGFNTNLEYKNFDFNMFWRASIGNYVYNNVDSQHGFQHQMLNNAFPNVINNGVQNAVETGFQNGGANRYLSDYYVQDASFAKLDNLTLGYSFDKFLKESKIRAYVSVQNVLIITDYEGSDPEVFGGIDYNIYPKPRTFAFGLNINF
jgi:iron complex outermembrane receptor protein